MKTLSKENLQTQESTMTFDTYVATVIQRLFYGGVLQAFSSVSRIRYKVAEKDIYRITGITQTSKS
jgi:hypothetical protein